jgi:hypothetical protein
MPQRCWAVVQQYIYPVMQAANLINNKVNYPVKVKVPLAPPRQVNGRGLINHHSSGHQAPDSLSRQTEIRITLPRADRRAGAQGHQTRCWLAEYLPAAAFPRIRIPRIPK